VADSGITAETDVPVHVAWSRVMGEVQWIAKANRTTSGSQYNYRGVDLVLDAVAPALRKHGVIVMPVKVAPEYTVINTTKGSAMNYCRVVAAFAIVGPAATCCRHRTTLVCWCRCSARRSAKASTPATSRR
jgi:hypothetical protein